MNSENTFSKHVPIDGFHGAVPSAPLLKPIRNNRRGTIDTALTADGDHQVLKHYGRKIGVSVDRLGPHSARATAATNALDGADIAKVQEWLGHANVSTTRVYDHRKTRPEDSLRIPAIVNGDSTRW